VSDQVKLLLDGDIIPVTHLFDEAGEAVGTWKEAATFVAGPLPDGRWLSDRCDDYVERLVQ
jgi:hypothetical protein